MNPLDTIRNYHQSTKHHLNGYARGPEYLDWDNQPDPFRRFHGSPLIDLPLNPDPTEGIAALNFDGIAKFLELSLGLSAWKEYGPDRWALRCNPSSGNLHPTEGYVVCHKMNGLDDGIYHYAPREHGLEQRASLVSADEEAYCLVGLSSIAWREAWKYGERAYRYVQLDIGHALGAIRYAAAVLGWRVTFLNFSDSAISNLLGLSRADDFNDAEQEWPDLILQLHADTDYRLNNLPQGINWKGKANPLGGDPYLAWPIIDQAHHACIQEHPVYPESKNIPSALAKISQAELARLIRRRRSAQAFVAKQSIMSLQSFQQLLEAMLPKPETLPWDVWLNQPRVHLILFIHRVDGLLPGVYALLRQPDQLPTLQKALDGEFEWETTPLTNDSLPFYRLATGDTRKAARTLSCHQEIASASSFSFSMLAEFDQALTQGASAYRHLYWEAGLIGQVAYLEAERVGMRGTGIGCFFDDNVHDVLGIENTNWQSLYHFTVGYSHVDSRLQTHPPYEHLKR